MNKVQKQANVDFFNMIISITKEGGTYGWPDEQETFVVKDGKFISSSTAIDKIKKVTLPSFHSKLKVG